MVLLLHAVVEMSKLAFLKHFGGYMLVCVSFQDVVARLPNDRPGQRCQATCMLYRCVHV